MELKRRSSCINSKQLVFDSSLIERNSKLANNFKFENQFHAMSRRNSAILKLKTGRNFSKPANLDPKESFPQNDALNRTTDYKSNSVQYKKLAHSSSFSNFSIKTIDLIGENIYPFDAKKSIVQYPCNLSNRNTPLKANFSFSGIKSFSQNKPYITIAKSRKKVIRKKNSDQESLDRNSSFNEKKYEKNNLGDQFDSKKTLGRSNSHFELIKNNFPDVQTNNKSKEKNEKFQNFSQIKNLPLYRISVENNLFSKLRNFRGRTKNSDVAEEETVVYEYCSII